MQNLQGLSLADFEKKGIVVLGKAEVDKDGTGNFVELEDVISFDVQSTITNLFLKTCAKSFSIELLNTNDRYSFFDTGKSKYNWIREGRKIRLYIGIKSKENIEVSREKNNITVTCSDDGHLLSEDTNNNYEVARGKESADYLEKYFTVGVGQSGNTYWGEYYIYRAFLYFDTSTIPSNAIIKKATLNINITEIQITSTNFDIVVQNGQPNYPSDILQESDFNMAYYSGNGGAGNTSKGIGYLNIELNEDGISWINKGGITKLCLRSNRDINGIKPVNSEYIFFVSCRNEEDIPTLDIEYEIPEYEEIDSDFYWSWIHGIIDKATTRYDANSETCSISGRDCIAYLSENYLKKLWWGKNKRYSVISGKEKYDMEEDCKGIHNAFIDWSGTRQNFKPMTFNSEYTYDWTTNQLVFLLPQVPGIGGSNCLWVYYYTPQKVEDVVADLLIEAGILTHSHKQAWLNSGRVTPTNLYIDRCYFNSNTTYLHAIELLSEVALYNFYIDGEGVPCFKQIPPTLPELVVRLNSNEYMVRNMEERLDELYNHFIIQGERREMKVKDLSLELYQNPVVTTSTAVLKAAILDNGGNAITQRGFIWKKGEEAEQSWYASGEYSGLFTHMISGLMPDTEYKFCAFARTAKQYKQTVWSYFKTESEE